MARAKIRLAKKALKEARAASVMIGEPSLAAEAK
jgi:hypothetical protein